MEEVVDSYEGATSGNVVEEGTVVFLKSETASDNDMWDDTALVKAYDKAIQMAYQSNSDYKPPKSKKKNKGKKKGDKSQKTWKWNTGNECQAVYSDDGLVYDAVITRMLGHGRCVVQYTDYGNEEEQLLTDLIKPHTHSHQQHHQRAASLRSVSPARSTGCSECSTSTNPANHYMSDGVPRFASPTAPPRSAPSTNGLPSFIPPPPPTIPDMSSCDTDEAFHSMLISWYMSGFHTGYYQGLKEGRSSKHY